MPQEIQFQAKNNDGKEIQYIVALHPAGVGFDLFYKVAEILSGSVPHLLGSITADEKHRLRDELPSEIKKPFLDADVSELSIDGGKVSVALREFAELVLKNGGVNLAKELLRYTFRVDPDSGAKLPVSSIFDVVYAGNYGELMYVLAMVIWHNFGKSIIGLIGPFVGGAMMELFTKALKK